MSSLYFYIFLCSPENPMFLELIIWIWYNKGKIIKEEEECLLETRFKKQAALLGVRIGLMFLFASGILILIAYFVLYRNFQTLLTDYTIQLVQAMTDQGVTTVEHELRVGREEVSVLAEAFMAPDNGEQAVVFPASLTQSDSVRLVYVSDTDSTASDGRQRDVRSRPDIVSAYGGETAVYGPYFNEDNEYIICYAAPVRKNGEIVGVLSIEKDGYCFNEVIKSFRFADTGESYIINAEGTDIAVSDPDHISWVNEQYNARKLLEVQEDPTTRQILEFEQKGLNGETGAGSYYWEDRLFYIAYAPIPSVNWVLFVGLRQDEIDAMTQSVLYASIVRGPTLVLCIAAFLILTAIIIYWIVSSMKKNAEINKQLNVLANYDALTGVMNRNSYHAALDALSNSRHQSLACIYIDANGLHEINNHLGHQSGDAMLTAVADVLKQLFEQSNVYRIGGDEFVVFSKDKTEEEVSHCLKLVRQSLKNQGYEVSIGIKWQGKDMDIITLVNLAEEAMQRDKQKYYQENGKERQIRRLDQKLEQMVLEKQDADTFLSVIAPGFKGVYFVDMGKDTIRHLFIPSYFEEILKETDDIFSEALRLYSKRIVMSDYQYSLEQFCDYDYVKQQLSKSNAPEFIYQKKDGSWMKLQILKFKTYTDQCQETLWIFSNVER